MGARLRLSLVLLAGLLLQTTLMPDLRIRGASPDLMLLIAICAGLAGGAELGGLVGFGAGLLIDLFLQTTPFGLSALAYCLVGFGVGMVRRGVLRDGFLLTPAMTVIASAVGVGTFVVAGVMVGQTQLTQVGPRTIAETAGIVAFTNAILSIPISRVVGWAAAGSSGAPKTRVELGSPAPTRSRAAQVARSKAGWSAGLK